MATSGPRRGRPPVSTRDFLEAVAFELLLRDGFEATTVQAVMAAGGVGRSTFFRYFGSKAGIVFGEFDRAIERLRGQLDAAGDVPVMRAVVDAVTESTRLSREAARDTWLDRFRVLDGDHALASETSERWRAWASEITRYVERREGLAAGSIEAAAIGGAVEAAYVAVLRQWAAAGDADPTTMRAELDPLGAALQGLLRKKR